MKRLMQIQNRSGADFVDCTERARRIDHKLLKMVLAAHFFSVIPTSIEIRTIVMSAGHFIYPEIMLLLGEAFDREGMEGRY